tara:strand:+ start:1474 stop:3306 length:1833 start_codon:yes stop_codon:yes gene_type:complete
LTYILGISAFYHDSAAALIKDGEIKMAIQEERLTRIKHDSSFPINSITTILEKTNINLDDIDYVSFYEKPFLKFERLIETYLANIPFGFDSFKIAIPIWIKEKLFLKKIIYNELQKISKNFNIEKLLFDEHHLSHAASAFFPSPFEEAIILTIDGVGEWATTTLSIGRSNNIKIEKEINFPHSLGLLYSAFTYYLGFKVNSGEYKVMGLAPYGKPIYKDIIYKNLIDIKNDGSFRLNQKFFNYMTGLKMTNKKFARLFNKPERKMNGEKIEQFHMDIAASIQEILEEIILKLIKSISYEYKIKNLCLAGGVALNCVSNSKILNSNYFENIWIQPSAGDAGGCVGTALNVYYHHLKNIRNVNSNDSMNGAYLGNEYSDNEINTTLTKLGAKFNRMNNEKLILFTAKKLEEGNAIGWHQGRMEFGPRSLGNRSILADPRSDKMQRNLNLKIKFREGFRPFAPAVLKEDLEDWFNIKVQSPYMLLVADVNDNKKIQNIYNDNIEGFEKLNLKRSLIPAVTHVDYSARVQTVDKKYNKIFHDLIYEFKKITDVPILVNTSFNVRGEPIVCSPYDAFNCFMGTNLDYLIIGNYVLNKHDQDKKLISDYKNKYELD